MGETEWLDSVVEEVSRHVTKYDKSLRLKTRFPLAYGFEIISFSGETCHTNTKTFQTDLAVIENLGEDIWKPRVIVEAKLGSITTHDAITYGHKASLHKAVFPYLRYGVLLGNRSHHPLPGRLYRHGSRFDFMISFIGLRPTPKEIKCFTDLLISEVAASRTLESVLYESRKKDRDHYTFLQRKLIVGNSNA